MTEIVNTTKKQGKGIGNPDWKPGMKSPNPNGRPEGSKNFSTMFDEAIIKIAKEEKISPNDAELSLIRRAYSEAKKGNFNYFKDLMDRKYGQPTKPIDLTTGGESFFRPTEEEKAKALRALQQINE